ncbi:phosphate acyltransferase [Pseudenhygromyxa sp. WMMC2535]|uniref:phosphate acyltransferase n=1 Tax=Pseudenhygromyxa sp. WMMC2535 TaxID=2712867 RepID=UPI00155167B6|nr:phosphate acyltransferase [Pseudenhygromyxa sp. WMMC2535]NVB41642.1 phosphate acyltransferase [Pseudenhygromyxa sp. WMMC2535]NVB43496.1 phosphate acyltransferase [Pseudenhygromyxa sp. WMMC2535]
MSPARLSLDAFGTDLRPEVELRAAVLAAEAGLSLDLVGDRALLEPGLARVLRARAAGLELESGLDRPIQAEPAAIDDARLAALEAALAERVAIVHAPDQITMDESPARAVRAKPASSMLVAVDRVASGATTGIVSAGSSGALLAAGLFRLGRISGVDRPAILTAFPRVSLSMNAAAPQVGSSDRTLVLDAGANVDCRPLNLVQFAVMGAVVARVASGIERPKVGLLCNGSEPGKGTALTRQTHELLQRWPSAAFEYVGLVEPGAVFGDTCDVAVCDGWTGNMLLKLGEGAMVSWSAMLREQLRGESLSPAIASALSSLEARVDPSSTGGAPLIGVDGTLIICHGASRPRALVNALLMARQADDRKLGEALAGALGDHQGLFDDARVQR